MRGAIGKMDGVGEIAIKAGDKDFTVNFDSKKVKLDAIVAALKAVEPGTKVKS